MDFEDLADATFDRVARNLSSARDVEIRSPIGYVLGTARLIWLESVRREVSQRRRLGNHEATKDQDERDADRELDLAVLERCLAELGPDERTLMLVYYDGRGRTRIEAREELVRRFGLTPGLLRTRVHRLRAQLELRVRTMLATVEQMS